MGIKRFHVVDNGYKYDKLIFWFGILACLGLALYVASLYDFDFSPKFYAVCVGDYLGGDVGICDNPIYFSDYRHKCNYEWCNSPTLEPGEYGDKPPDSVIFNHFGVICFMIFIVMFGLNHLFYNWGKWPGFKLNVSDKTWAYLKEHMAKAGDQLEDEEDYNNREE